MAVADKPSGAEAASMRPAQKAPENGNARREQGPRHGGFNEAGAKSAGKLGHP